MSEEQYLEQMYAAKVAARELEAARVKFFQKLAARKAKARHKHASNYTPPKKKNR